MNKKIEELLGGIQRFSTEDGPGIRTTVFFKGCPLNCQWCHNPELISSKPDLMYSKQKCIQCEGCVNACPLHALRLQANEIEIEREVCVSCGKCVENCYTAALRFSGESKEDDELVELLAKDKGFYKETGGGVTFSGGEVTSQADYAYRILQRCNDKKIGVAIDTYGYCREEQLIKLCKSAEIILFDIKCMDDENHKQLTGVSNQLILDNLKKLCELPGIKEKIIIRLPLIHPVNDTKEDLIKVCNLLNQLGLEKVDGLPYHSLGTAKSRKLGEVPIEFETPPDAYLDEIVALFKRFGLSIRIMGRDEKE